MTDTDAALREAARLIGYFRDGVVLGAEDWRKIGAAMDALAAASPAPLDAVSDGGFKGRFTVASPAPALVGYRQHSPQNIETVLAPAPLDVERLRQAIDVHGYTIAGDYDHCVPSCVPHIAAEYARLAAEEGS